MRNYGKSSPRYFALLYGMMMGLVVSVIDRRLIEMIIDGCLVIQKSLDWLDINGIALPRPFQRLNRLSPEAAIYQRPSSWDGQLRIGDAVRLKKFRSGLYCKWFFQ